MSGVVVTEEFLRELIEHAGSNTGREGLHGRLDALEGAVGREALARRAAAEAQTPEQRAAKREALAAQAAELDALEQPA